jgi:selenide,water dikinase
VVDDPYTFGQIAAANSLSDVYTVGARPLTALNLVCFPSNKLSLDVLEQILKGGLDKIREAGASLVGGHSIEDEEPKYGLAVTGVVDPRQMVTGCGARPGDLLVLTKPLGTGVITTALKGKVISAPEAEAAIAGMAALNAGASRAMVETGVSACTDITGFGLIGHLHELLISSGVAARVESAAVPFYPLALDLAAQGMIPAGAYRNRDHFRCAVNWEAGAAAEEELLIMFADPQTSGGLLMAVPPERISALRAALHRYGAAAAVIGEIEAGTAGRISFI